jgi:spermidine synthase
MNSSQSVSILPRLRFVHPAVYWSVLSGMAALIYQVVLQKIFSYLLGGALLSTTIVVAAYMAGLALGGFFAGLFCDRLSPRRNQILYGCIETAIAICGVGSLFAYTIYLSKLSALIASPAIVSLLSSIPFRAVAALVALLPMTVLMGATLPVLALGIHATTGEKGKARSAPTVSVSSLYSANLLGGMAGVLISAYLVMPNFGLWGATLLACAANLAIAFLVFRFRLLDIASTRTAPDEAHGEAALQREPAPSPSPSFGMVCFLGFSSGLVMFALEIVWTHLLATVIGSSVYAFANMLLAVFAALYLAARREEQPQSARTPLSRLVLLASILLAISVPFYAISPILFSIVGLGEPGFFVREVARVAVACFLIVPVGILLSRIFPRLLAVGIPAGRKGRGVGFLLSINTFGCLLGLFLGNFVLIPLVGSQIALKGMAVLLGLVAWIVYRRSPKTPQTPSLFQYKAEFALLILAVVAVAVPSWPPSLLLSNRNTYFGVMPEGDLQTVLYLGEDAESGFVSVSRNSGGDTELRTNGKFQGDNGPQMSAQFSFGYLPALAAPHHEKAFVVGCGTGVTVRALADSGFKEIRLAELSKPILFAARTYFHDVNGGILDDPRVTVIHDDGRNALALSGEKYDVISVELTSIWFAGAANLYSSDFYSIVHQKLEPGGVFQQWVQFHHMRLEDLYVLLNTVHTRFKYVALWSGGGQGQLLASDEPLSLDWQRMRALAASHPDARYITAEEIYRIPFRIMLDDNALQAFVSYDSLKSVLGHGVAAKMLPPRLERMRLAQFIDSDLYPYLEYATPRGNATTRQELLIPAYLAQQADKPVSVPLRNVPTADQPLAKALLAYQNGACDEVGKLLESGTAVQAGDDLRFLHKCTPNMSFRVLDLH